MTVMLISIVGFPLSLFTDNNNTIPITFEGMGRLYSLEDEMAKPMCKGNTLHLGEYLLHVNRIGLKGGTRQLYPFAIYIPSVISKTSPIEFSSCLDPKENCPSPHLKEGSRWNQMHLINKGSAGKFKVIVGAGLTPNEVTGYTNFTKALNDNSLHSSFDMKGISKVLEEKMIGKIGSRIFSVVNPGECTG